MDHMSQAALDALQQTNFTKVDWAIVICYPMISVVIGLFVRKYISNMKDFVTAGQGLGTCLGIATLTGTELGLITVMFSAQKGFTGGFAAFHIALAAALATFFVGVSGFLLYRLRSMGVLTIPGYYGRRFGKKAQVLGGVMMAFAGILNMGLFLMVGAKFLVGITGISDEDWALPAIMTFLLTLVLIYTCMGGMLSVVIADYVQFVVLSVGLVVTTVLAIYNLGWNNIFDTVFALKGPAGFDPTIASEETGFGLEYVAWMFFLGIVGCAIWPTSVARALAAESPATVKKQYTWASLSYLIRQLVPFFWGICAFVFISTQDDTLKQIFFPTNADVPPMDNLYAMPIFLGRLLPPVVIGIISAGMVAAFMSTHDSYLLCWSSVLTEDVVAPLCKKELTPKTRIFLTRSFIVLIGVYVFIWGMTYKGGDDVWDYMAVTGAVYFTGAFSLLFCGLYWKRASSTGAVLSLLTGSVAILGLSPVQTGIGISMTALGHMSQGLWNFFTWLPGVSIGGENYDALIWNVSSARIGLITIAATMLVMVVGSLLFPNRDNQAELESE